MPYADPFNTADGGGYKNYFLNNTPEAGFWNYLQTRGLLGTSNRDRFAQGAYGRLYGQFTANAADNPNEGFFDYLNRVKPDLEREFMDQAPDQRGDSSSRTLTPKARFIRAY